MQSLADSGSGCLRRESATPGLLVLGDMSVHGTIEPARSPVEPLRVAVDNGAKRAFVAIEGTRNFLEVSADNVERVDPPFHREWAVRTVTPQ